MPPRKPGSVREKEGNPGHRLIPTEIDYPGGIKMPAGLLNKSAKAEWRRIVSALADLDVLKATDASVLAAYCVCFSRWKAAELTLAKEGTVLKVVGSQGQEKWVKHPALMVSDDSMTAMMRAGKQLGFSPVDRVRVPASSKQADNPFAKIGAGEDDE